MRVSCLISSVKNTQYQRKKAIKLLKQFYPGREIRIEFFEAPENDLASPCITIHNPEPHDPTETPYYRPERPADEVVKGIFELLGIF